MSSAGTSAGAHRSRLPAPTPRPAALLAMELPPPDLEPPPESVDESVELKITTRKSAKPPDEAIARVESQEMDREQVAAILSRLNPLLPPEKVEFKLAPGMSEAPKRGRTIKEKFPPPAAMPSPAPASRAAARVTSPLYVERFSPQGEIDTSTRQLAVKFSQPMIPLSSVSAVKDPASLPVRLSPQPKGQWRWLDTRTLLFEPEEKYFPGSTEFVATVLPEARSIAGKSIGGEGKSFRFRTRLLAVTEYYPQSTVGDLSPLLFLGFNQRVDEAALLKKIRVSVRPRGGEGSSSSKAANVAFVRASESELLKDKELWRIVRGHVRGRWIAARLTEPLPKNSDVSIIVPPGTTSAEGPLPTKTQQSFSFETFGPLKMIRPATFPEARANDAVTVSFTNVLDRTAFKPSLVSVKPAIPGVAIEVDDRDITISGKKTPGATYTISVAGELKDGYGQRLGKPASMSFRVIGYAGGLFLPKTGLVTIASGMPEDFRVYSVNHKRLRVRAFKASPELWQPFNEDRKSFVTALSKRQPLFDKRISVAANDTPVETIVDLRQTFAGGNKQLVLFVQPEGQPPDSLRSDQVVWVQRTDLGVSAVFDYQQMYASVRNLSDGNAMPGVSVKFYPSGGSATTDSKGTARLSLPEARADQAVVVVSSGNDTCLFPGERSVYRTGFQASWSKDPQHDRLAWFVFTDRGVYRPGEEVHFKGWVRRMAIGPSGDIQPANLVGPVKARVADSQGSEIFARDLKVDDFGGLSGSFKLPASPSLGTATLTLDSGDQYRKSSTHTFAESFQIQEFRRPEFKVSVTAENNPPELVGRPILLGAHAQYFSGGDLAGSQVNWHVEAMRASFTPAGWSEFHFGRSAGWWWDAGPQAYQPSSLGAQSASDIADSAGRSGIAVSVARFVVPQPMSIQAEATIFDVNRQAYSHTASVLVHPSSAYVGIKPRKSYFAASEPVSFEYVVTGIDGRVLDGIPVSFELTRREFAGRGQERVGKLVKEERSKSSPGSISFESVDGGAYMLTARVSDPEGRFNLTEQSVFVSGSAWQDSGEKRQVQLIPDKEVYNPGDVAELAVVSPYQKARGILTLARCGVVEQSQFSTTGPTHVLRIPIKAAYLPNVYAHVDLIGQCKDPPKEGYQCAVSRISGSVNLAVSTRQRKLSVSVEPEASLLVPGAETSVSLAVKDDEGRPAAGTQVALVVVDEAVLALTGYQMKDPLELFYRQWPAILHDCESFGIIEPVVPSADKAKAGEQLVPDGWVHLSFFGHGLAAGEGRSGGGGAGGGYADAVAALPPPPLPGAAEAEKEVSGSKIRIRKNFNALAVFKASVLTDSNGTAKVKYSLPDNLTSYRIMTVAADSSQRFGKGESSITVRQPVMVRPSPPRFLNVGDECMIPVVVQNQTDADQNVGVVLRSTLPGLKDGLGRLATIKAGGRGEFLFPARVDTPGTCHFQAGVVAGDLSDAQGFSLPVLTPATSEAFAVYGTLDGDQTVHQSLVAPADSFIQYGGLEISTSSTALTELSDAVSYLMSYGFECSEQLASRALVLAALKDVTRAFHIASLEKPEVADHLVRTGIRQLLQRQNYDGSFALWKRGERERWPYVSIYVTHALWVCREKGYDVPQSALSSARHYLRNIERNLDRREYPGESWRAVNAYALYVEKLLGEKTAVSRARALLSKTSASRQSPETLAHLLMILHDDKNSQAEVEAIRSALTNQIGESSSTASLASPYGDCGYMLFYSATRADALVLCAMVDDNPQGDLVPKLLKGLLRSRQNGAWSNTQENAFAAMAVDRYFNACEARVPDFTTKIWLGESGVADQKFAGRSLDTRAVDIPMQYLAEHAARSSLTLAKSGPGRLYYRFGLRYAPKNLRLEPLDNGFSVTRTYEGAEQRQDVRRDSDGVWHVKAGAPVRVKVEMRLPGRRFHVALVDRLPAGFEALNSDLLGTQKIERTERKSEDDSGESVSAPAWWWSPPTWWQHENLRDDRTEAFASVLWDGAYKYNYIARATTPGKFVVPPAKAEEMYEPETFGRTATETIIIE